MVLVRGRAWTHHSELDFLRTKCNYNSSNMPLHKLASPIRDSEYLSFLLAISFGILLRFQCIIFVIEDPLFIRFYFILEKKRCLVDFAIIF